MTKYFLSKGYSVLGISRRVPEDLIQYQQFKHASIDLSQSLNTTKLDELFQGIEQVESAVLNAGILGEIKDMKETSLEEIDKVMQINVWANKQFLDYLLAKVRVKQVVAISSGASINGNRGWSAYSISKAALNMMVKLYAAEHPQVHFTSLAPGLINSDMQDYLCHQVDEEVFPSVNRLKQAKETGVMPTPEEAGEIVGSSLEKLMALESGAYADVRKL
ncbi:SDR family NAD(P)-dependent oxidoreductase [Algivirga pacifica]|uniref:SDR family NAD(P)-dependent oxidoreductase n=2 Tax=Algivirga pacifica TaxID=1162670 RepID=A0ABP9DDW3_9BACT